MENKADNNQMPAEITGGFINIETDIVGHSYSASPLGHLLLGPVERWLMYEVEGVTLW